MVQVRERRANALAKPVIRRLLATLLVSLALGGGAYAERGPAEAIAAAISRLAQPDTPPAERWALLTQLGNKAASDRSFWGPMTDAAIRSSQPNLERLIRALAPTERKTLAQAALNIPALATLVVEMRPEQPPGQADLDTIDMLRRADHLSAAAQERVATLARTDVSARQMILAEPGRFLTVLPALIAQADAAEAGPSALALDLARLTGGRVDGGVVARILARGDEQSFRAAARWIEAHPEEAKTLIGTIRDLRRDATGARWGDLTDLEALADPQVALQAFADADQRLQSDGPALQGAVRALGRVGPAADGALFQLASDAADAKASCGFRAAVLTALARRFRVGTTLPAEPDLSVAAAGALASALAAKDDCKAGELPAAMEEVAGSGLVADPRLLEAFRITASREAGELSRGVSRTLLGAPRLCKALAVPLLPLALSGGWDAASVAGVIVPCLGPSEAATTRLAGALDALLAAPDPSTGVAVLTGLRATPPTGALAAAVRSAAAASRDRSDEVRAALALLLQAMGEQEKALATADQIKAEPAYEALLSDLLKAGAETGRVLTRERVARIAPSLGGTDSLSGAARLLAVADLPPSEVIGGPVFDLLARASQPVASLCWDLVVVGAQAEVILPALVERAVLNREPREQLAGCARAAVSDPDARALALGLAGGRADGIPQEGAEVDLRRLGLLEAIWPFVEKRAETEFRALRALVLDAAGELGRASPYSPEGISRLARWRDRVREGDPRQPFSPEIWKRQAALASLAIPGGVLLQFGIWALILARFRSSTRVQSLILYNPRLRNLIFVGTFDWILLRVPAICRIVFAPFEGRLLGDLAAEMPEAAEAAYFGGSGVAPVTGRDIDRRLKAFEDGILSGTFQPDTTVVEAFAGWRGRVLLLGPSGRGKTSFLRHHFVSQGRLRQPAVYLRAGECGAGVVEAVSARLPGAFRDADLIRSLIRDGAFDVYIDGLNEVPPQTRIQIVAFVLDNRDRGNIFLTSQYVGDGIPPAETYYLLPLTHAQMSDFIRTRGEHVDPDAPVRGAAFEAAGEAFLKALFEQRVDGVGVTDTAGDDDPDTRERRLLIEFRATLANPMDLQTAADIIAQGRVPDPVNLQQQQFDLVDEDHRELTGLPFPSERFAKAVFDATVTPNPEKPGLPLSAPERTVLLDHKQIRLQHMRAGDASAEIAVFRHDKIRDFYLHFAFLGDDQALRFQYARDDRFGGVYDLLARRLPSGQAAELREFLLLKAVDDKDHRLSDRFIQQLRWRDAIERRDPLWLSRFDGERERAGLAEFARLRGEGKRIEAGMASAFASVEAGRAITRALSAADAIQLREAVAALLTAAEAAPDTSLSGPAMMVRTPDGNTLTFWCVASRGRLTALEMLPLRLVSPSGTGRHVVVVNAQADLDPAERDLGGQEAEVRAAVPSPALILSAVELHRAYRSAKQTEDLSRFWRDLSQTGGELT